MIHTPLRALLACGLALPALADPAEIVATDLTRTGETWRAEVTIRHADTGWDDYADGWRVEDASGSILGTRTLLHPHVEEQPFTRALGNIAIPDGLTQVQIRASTNTTGWADTTVTVPLP
ncbi:hypothetical protein [Tropicimonas sp. S265A]|uniref:hypothetical protein n=1 Tax=Tropicimonas sp. S265A TaxID=3415134 RepID=UPI003C7B32F4